ncbi:unnamed protein product, partial [marine sediment metagenome]
DSERDRLLAGFANDISSRLEKNVAMKRYY